MVCLLGCGNQVSPRFLLSGYWLTVFFSFKKTELTPPEAGRICEAHLPGELKHFVVFREHITDDLFKSLFPAYLDNYFYEFMRKSFTLIPVMDEDCKLAGPEVGFHDDPCHPDDLSLSFSVISATIATCLS